MQIHVLLFATLRDRVGERKLTLQYPGESATLGDLKAYLVRQYPALADNLPSANSAINEEFAFDADPVKDGDEVAFFPPVSGGQSDLPEVFQLAEEPIDHDEIVHAVTTPETGAVVVFSGMVRGKTQKDGHLPQTSHLEYEAYESMALAKMKQVADEIRQQYPDVLGIAIIQRVGRLEVGQNTILIACSSAHRDGGCFEGARYGIDRLKEIVPVWKKEIGTAGETWIEGDYQPTSDDRQS